mmetsp:Transcript_14164/g.34084  ORF Transcript_14164/g.34084 Transcript_14164/m.34084 type:complete len:230 (-) Transcript_14164:2035-2724(-)
MVRRDREPAAVQQRPAHQAADERGAVPGLHPQDDRGAPERAQHGGDPVGPRRVPAAHQHGGDDGAAAHEHLRTGDHGLTGPGQLDAQEQRAGGGGGGHEHDPRVRDHHRRQQQPGRVSDEGRGRPGLQAAGPPVCRGKHRKVAHGVQPRHHRGGAARGRRGADVGAGRGPAVVRRHRQPRPAVQRARRGHRGQVLLLVAGRRAPQAAGAAAAAARPHALRDAALGGRGE